MQRLDIKASVNLRCKCGRFLDWKWYKHHNDYLCIDCANAVSNKLLNKAVWHIEYEFEWKNSPAEILLEVRDILL